MNEKIKELAEEAAKKHGHTIKFSTEITETLDSFAELIVRECADVAYKYNRCDWADVSKSIKEHFGVEK